MRAGGGGLVWLASLFLFLAPEARCETVTLKWSKTFSGGAYRHFEGRGVAMDPSGDIFLAGFTTTTSGGTTWNVMKLSGDGAGIWSTSYNDASNNNAVANGIALDGSGNAVVVGMEKTTFNMNDWLIRKYSSSGSLLWSASYDSDWHNDDVAYGVAVNSKGEIAVAGSEYRADLGQGHNWTVRKYTSGGALISTTNYNNPETANSADFAFGCAFDRASNLFVAGCIDNQDSSTGTEAMVRKYSPGGDLLWSRTYGNTTSDNEQAFAVGVDASGSCFVAGSADNKNSIPSTGTDWLVLKYDGSGNLLWASTFTGPTPDSSAGGTGGNDIARAVVVDARGNAVVAGMEEYEYIPGGNHQLFNRKIRILDPGGAVTGEKTFTDTFPLTKYNDEFLGVSCDQYGYVTVAGYTAWPYDEGDAKFRRNLCVVNYLRSGWPSRAVVVSPDTGGDARLSRNAFSPDRGQSIIISAKPDYGAVVSVRVFTASGRLVCRLEGVRTGADGWSEASWDGKNSGGQWVSHGVYLVNVMSGEFNKTLKVVVR